MTSLATRQPSLEAVLSHFRALMQKDDSPIRAIRHQPARAAEFAEIPEAVHPKLREALIRRNVPKLYHHQAEAFALAASGKNVVVVTPTASGKTLCYNLPVLDLLLRDPDARAVYLYPTKALAEDQLHEFQTAADEIGGDLKAFTYDGDTPQDARKAIRQRAGVVMTNPDMLHSGILPHHTKWAKLFENLRYVVIDELHYYRGVYGSHVANLLRRLRRICEFYGSSPQFICSSATIANPRELAEALTEAPFEMVDRNGAPAGEKYFLFYNPPVVNRQLGIRRSYINETRRIALEFIERDQQTLVFANNRLATELLVTYLKDACDRGPLPPETVRGYRGGYLPRERREIERKLRDGEIRAVVATNALELGIDIGSLDAVVMAGYPGTIASTWQRAGRAGRRQSTSAAVLVASSAPLDQYIVEHPDYFFDRPPEHAYINPDNLEILLGHLKCAAFELPVADGEKFGPHETGDLCKFLGDAGFLHHSAGSWHWTSETYPADAIGLRSITSDNFVVVDITGEPNVIAEVSFPDGADDAAREGDLSARSAAIPRGALRLRRAQGVRAARELRLLHRTRSITRRSRCCRSSMARRYGRRRGAVTARCGSTGRSWDSRRSSSIRSRMSARGSCRCRSRRCTRRRSGCIFRLSSWRASRIFRRPINRTG